MSFGLAVRHRIQVGRGGGLGGGLLAAGGLLLLLLLLLSRNSVLPFGDLKLLGLDGEGEGLVAAACWLQVGQ